MPSANLLLFWICLVIIFLNILFFFFSFQARENFPSNNTFFRCTVADIQDLQDCAKITTSKATGTLQKLTGVKNTLNLHF